MKLKKHGIIVIGMIIACLSCVNLWISKAEGQEKHFPNKPIEIVNNTPPGGPLDNGARIITTELTKELGVAISISYKTGARGLDRSFLYYHREARWVYSAYCLEQRFYSCSLTRKGSSV